MSEYNDRLHPRENDGKFARKSYDEQSGGMNALAPTRVIVCPDALTRLAERLKQEEGLGNVNVWVREKDPVKAKLAVSVRGTEFHIDDSNHGDVYIWDSTPGACSYVPPVKVYENETVIDGLRKARERGVAFRAIAEADRAVLDNFGPDATRCDSPDAARVWDDTFRAARDRLRDQDAAAGW